MVLFRVREVRGFSDCFFIKKKIKNKIYNPNLETSVFHNVYLSNKRNLPKNLGSQLHNQPTNRTQLRKLSRSHHGGEVGGPRDPKKKNQPEMNGRSYSTVVAPPAELRSVGLSPLQKPWDVPCISAGSGEGMWKRDWGVFVGGLAQ